MAEVDGEGRLAMGGMRPGIAFTLRVFSAGGRRLFESEQEPLGLEERRECPIRIADALHTFRGTVLDELDRPLPGAAVHLSTGGKAAGYDGDNGGTSRRTDAGGRFAIPWIAAEQGLLTITRAGYLPLVLAEHSLADVDGEVTFRLTRGYTVAVRVLDEDGLELSAGRVRASAAGHDGWEGRAVGVARYELAGLPDVPVDVSLRLAGKDYVETHDPREPELTFVVPVHGSVGVAWDGANESAWQGWIMVELVPRDEELARLTYDAFGVARGEYVFPLVLPGEYEAFVIGDSEAGETQLTERIPLAVEAGRTSRVEFP